MVKDKTRLICLGLLLLFLCVYSVNAYLNYDASMVDDMVIYLRSAQALLHGKMIIDNPVYDLLKSHFPDMKHTLSPFVLNPAGQQVSVVSIGIAMLLAPLLALFGENAIWIARIVWDICIITGLFFTTRVFFKDRDRRSAWILAVLAIAAYGTVINFRLTFRRDIACAALTTLASLFALLASQKKRKVYWLAAFGLLCLTATVKIPQAILFLPMILLFVNSHHLRDMRVRPAITNGIAGIAIAMLIFTPFLIQNHVSSGHWYLPAQPPYEWKNIDLFRNTLASFVAICKAQAIIYSPKGFPAWWALPFLAIAAIGMWNQRRTAFVRWWVTPFLLLEYSFYVCWFIPCLDFAYTYNIYLAPVYPLVVFLFVCGLYTLVETIQHRPVLLWILASVFLLPFFAVKITRSVPCARPAHFRLPQVHRLVNDIESVIPPKSVVLCDAFLCFPLDYYSNSCFFPPSRLDDTTSTIIDKLSFLLTQNKAVFFCDYRGIEGSYAYQTKLESAFRLVLVKKDQQYYNHPNEFPVPPFSIYRIIPNKPTQ